MLTPVYCLDPLSDPRWDGLVAVHPDASIFHTSAWLRALRDTYGYSPVVFTTSAPTDELKNAWPFCKVKTYLTGPRLVSLPFSDHCEILRDSEGDLEGMWPKIAGEMERQGFRYIELRPISYWRAPSPESSRSSYWLHSLDLTPTVECLLRNCHKDSIQRKIRRADRELLSYQEGRSDFLLETFYKLQLITRRRHQILPQPRNWFKNLVEAFGPALKIRAAFKDRTPIAAVMTVKHQTTLVYKYGCSDQRFHNLGGMHLVLWRSILEGKSQGMTKFDLGRSDLDHDGLVTFKDRWGASRREITYSKVFCSPQAKLETSLFSGAWMRRAVKRAVASFSDEALSVAGRVVYRHLA